MAARNFINRVSGSKRALGHGQLYMGVGNLDFIRYEAEILKPDTWKGYNIATAAKVDFDPNSDMRRWALDDEEVAYPTYSLIDSYATPERLREYPGFRNLCVHKGLSTTAGRDPELGHPMDVPKAATDWPQFNFIIYHACIRPGFWVLNALTDINSGILRNGPRTPEDVGPGLKHGVPDILWSTEFAYLAQPFRNVYAEIGTTWASSVVTFPTVAAHLLGQFMKIMGPDRIVFGSDSVHYGAPQWQIDALWRFQIPDSIADRWKYPDLTDERKRMILGLNSARLYKLKVATVGDDDRGRGRDDDDRSRGRDDDDRDRSRIYKPVPANYQDLFDDQTKQIMEFPAGWTPCGDSCALNPFAQDNLSKMKKMYVEAGGKPDNLRLGWIRKRI
jgi:predicted TIM-barrel fold metal-dependent hydrolase